MWRRRDVERVKKKIKQELDSIGTREGMPARLHHALGQVRALEDDESSEGGLKRYVYAVSALVHHYRHRGLTRNQIRHLVALGDALLRVHGVQPYQSKVGFLYGDLHLSKSNAHYIEGEMWEAAWELQFSYYLSQRSLTGGRGFQNHSMGNLMSRLGLASVAIECFSEAERLGLPDGYLDRNRFELVRALRLHGDLDQALRICGQGASGPESLTFAWETLSIRAMRGEIEPLVTSTLPKHSHHAAEFALEAYLWTRLVRTRTWLVRFPTLQRLARGVKFERERHGRLLTIVKTLEQCYDPAVAIALKLRNLGDQLAETRALDSTHKELLVLAAAARWLVRARLPGFAIVALGRYRELSLLLSDGTSSDVLKHLDDLIPLVQSKASEPVAVQEKIRKAGS